MTRPFHRCVCGRVEHDWQQFLWHTEACADWAAYEEHETEATG